MGPMVSLIKRLHCTFSTGSKEVDELQQIMKKAIDEIHETNERLLAFIVEVDDIQDVKIYGVSINK